MEQAIEEQMRPYQKAVDAWMTVPGASPLFLFFSSWLISWPECAAWEVIPAGLRQE